MTTFCDNRTLRRYKQNMFNISTYVGLSFLKVQVCAKSEISLRQGFFLSQNRKRTNRIAQWKKKLEFLKHWPFVHYCLSSHLFELFWCRLEVTADKTRLTHLLSNAFHLCNFFVLPLTVSEIWQVKNLGKKKLLEIIEISHRK